MTPFLSKRIGHSSLWIWASPLLPEAALSSFGFLGFGSFFFFNWHLDLNFKLQEELQEASAASTVSVSTIHATMSFLAISYQLLSGEDRGVQALS